MRNAIVGITAAGLLTFGTYRSADAYLQTAVEPNREYSGTIKRRDSRFEIRRTEGMRTTDTTLEYIDEILDGDFTHKDDFQLLLSVYDMMFSLGLAEKMPSTIKALEYERKYEQLPESRKRQLMNENPDTIRKLKDTSATARSAMEGIRNFASAQTLSGVGYDEIMAHVYSINRGKTTEIYTSMLD